MRLLQPPAYPEGNEREPLPWVDVEADLSLCWSRLTVDFAVCWLICLFCFCTLFSNIYCKINQKLSDLCNFYSKLDFWKIFIRNYFLIFLTLLLLNTTCPVLANSVDPDQLASEEAN